MDIVVYLQGYSNADNPFGDERLLDTFVWNKKLEQEGKKDVPISEVQKMAKQKLLESKVDFGKDILSLFYLDMSCVLYLLRSLSLSLPVSL